MSNFIASMRLPGIGGGFPSFPGAGQNKGEGISGSSKSKAAASVHSMLRTYEKAAPKPIKPRKTEKVRLTTKPMRWG